MTGASDPATLAARLAAIAHEIGTPIAVASMAAALIREDLVRLAGIVAPEGAALVDDARANADAVARNLERAERLLASFRRSARAEGLGGTAAATAIVTDLAGALRDAIATLEPALKKAQVTAEVRAERPVEVALDAGALAQVAVNLVLNAARHAYRGAPGRVEVIVRAGETGAGGGAAATLIEFRDRGRGIDAEALGRIWEPFFTTDANGGGTGLGLAVVKELVEGRLRGAISVESAPGRGTTFIVRIPHGG